jgi:molybdopterin converting factor small subunit
MLKIKVEFFSIIEDITHVKKKEVVLEKDSPTLMNLLHALFEEFGTAFEEAVFDRSGNNLKPGILVAVNGKNAYLLEGTGTLLNDGDYIVIGFSFRGG